MILYVYLYFLRYTLRIMARVSPNKSATLLDLALGGPIRSRDLAARGIPRAYLRRLCDRGLLVREDRGLYRHAAAPASGLHSLAVVQKRLPGAVICLLSALQAHELTTEAPPHVWVMLPRHARKPTVNNPRIEVVRASGNALEHGVVVRTIESVRVRLTTPAKTVADCFRYRRHVGLEVALDALRSYLEKPRASVDALIAAANADRIYPFMRPYLEALA